MIKEVRREELSDYKFSENLDNEELYGSFSNLFAHLLIYVLDNTVIAYMWYSDIYERIELDYLWVSENHRRKKIASQLLARIVNMEKNITLQVRVDNDRAIRLYKKIGFKIIRTINNYYVNKNIKKEITDAFEMMLDI